MSALFRPLTPDNNSFEQWQAEGGRDAATRANALWKKQLERYEDPGLDPAIDEALQGLYRQGEGLHAGCELLLMPQIIIIGGGAVGLSVAYHLRQARREGRACCSSATSSPPAPAGMRRASSGPCAPPPR